MNFLPTFCSQWPDALAIGRMAQLDGRLDERLHFRLISRRPKTVASRTLCPSSPIFANNTTRSSRSFGTTDTLITVGVFESPGTGPRGDHAEVRNRRAIVLRAVRHAGGGGAAPAAPRRPRAACRPLLFTRQPSFIDSVYPSHRGGRRTRGRRSPTACLDGLWGDLDAGRSSRTAKGELHISAAARRRILVCLSGVDRQGRSQA